MKWKIIAGSLSILCSSFAMAAEVRLNGATTVVDRVVNPYGAAVEKATGHTLKIVGNATGRGLVDLVEGRCDASLASEPLDIAVAAAKAAGKTIDPGTLQLHVIRKDEIVFVVNKSNPVSKLSLQQIKDIHTGKISNWKEVGGPDLPIVVFADALTGGTRAMIKSVVLNGDEFGAAVKTQPSVKKAAEMVDSTEGGIAGVGKGFVEKDAKVAIIQTTKIERPLSIVTQGKPSADVAAVIDAFKAQASK